MMTISASAELVLRQDRRLPAVSVQRLRQILEGCEEVQRVLSQIPKRPAATASSRSRLSFPTARPSRGGRRLRSEEDHA